MRIPYTALLLVILLNGAVDYCIYRWLKKQSRGRIPANIQLWSAIVLLLGLLSLLVLPVQSTTDNVLRALMWVIFFYISIYVPKYIFVLFYGISLIPKLWHSPRIKGVTATGGVLGIILFITLWWGALINRYNITVNEVTVPVKAWPIGFDGFRIVQISDLHLGTYGTDTTFVHRLVERINALNPDIIVFTGDIVNRHTDELIPFSKVLSHLNAPYGIYSILGNHDYGDYYAWKDSSAYDLNNKKMEVIQKEMGWNLLKNEHRFITSQGDSLAIIGVENIGDPPFHVYGNLHAAYETPEDEYPKMLLTHNPAHWVDEVSDSNNNIALTMAGHTHAMQIELFGWSPAVFRYKTWGGLYHDKSETHYLYVNTGTGTVGFPARIGAAPEITLLTLKSN
ncbi:MAG: metallophosphoesterase [Muribaculaceae bacterium]|nr:metallophosphoesterase [Muribaculaceae bacterium]